MFYFDLCLEIGGMTVDEMLNRMTSAEITYWAARYRIKRVEQQQVMDRQKSMARLKSGRKAF